MYYDRGLELAAESDEESIGGRAFLHMLDYLCPLRICYENLSYCWGATATMAIAGTTL